MINKIIIRSLSLSFKLKTLSVIIGTGIVLTCERICCSILTMTMQFTFNIYYFLVLYYGLIDAISLIATVSFSSLGLNKTKNVYLYSLLIMFNIF